MLLVSSSGFSNTRHLVKRSCFRVCQAYLKEEVKKRPASSAFASDDEEGKRVKLTFWKIDGLLTASSKVMCPDEGALSNFSSPSSPTARAFTMPPVRSSRCKYAVPAPNQIKKCDRENPRCGRCAETGKWCAAVGSRSAPPNLLSCAYNCTSWDEQRRPYHV
jgi:hypothetical protein